MKIQYLALPLVALLPACAWAQTNSLPPAPSSAKKGPMVIDAAASTLLYRAMQTYKKASGLRLRVGLNADGKDAGVSNIAFSRGKDAGTNEIAFSRPNLISVERGTGKEAVRLLFDGSDFYVVQGTSYRKQAAPASLGTGQLLGGFGGTAGQFIGAMLDGKNPIGAMQTQYSAAPFKSFKGKTVALAPRVVDGDVFSGVQSAFTIGLPGANGTTKIVHEQLTAWFGGTPLSLRRLQTRYTQDGKTVTLSEKIISQQISPTFESDAFKFNDSGLKPVSDESGAGGGEEKYWDARLEVGKEPFAFSAKTLTGASIAPNQYKGKVLLMDFWATWCGPCVASLPELKGAYDKYHSQGLEVVGISLDEDKAALTSFIKTNKMTWPQIYDGKGWSSAVPGVYGVKAIPFMLIIGRDGKIAAVNPRGNIDAAVKAALAVKPVSAQLPAQEEEDIYWDTRLKVGTQPFDFAANTLDETPITPAQYKGKVLLLDFWATWCGPCVASLPELQATYNKYHEQGLEVVGISLDRDKSKLTTFIAERKMAWPQVFDPDQKARVAKTYGVKAIPFFLIIGRDGKIAAVNPRDDLEGAVKAALAAK